MSMSTLSIAGVLRIQMWRSTRDPLLSWLAELLLVILLRPSFFVRSLKDATFCVCYGQQTPGGMLEAFQLSLLQS